MTETPDSQSTPTLENPRVQAADGRYTITVDDSGTPAGFTVFVEHTDVTDRKVRIFPHTEVRDEFEGHGVASTLVREALDESIAQGWDIVPVCPYVKSWIERHEGYEEHVVTPTPEHLEVLRQGS